MLASCVARRVEDQIGCGKLGMQILLVKHEYRTARFRVLSLLLLLLLLWRRGEKRNELEIITGAIGGDGPASRGKLGKRE